MSETKEFVKCESCGRDASVGKVYRRFIGIRGADYVDHNYCGLVCLDDHQNGKTG